MSMNICEAENAPRSDFVNKRTRLTGGLPANISPASARIENFKFLENEEGMIYLGKRPAVDLF
jgi:hypothetical protein